MLSFSGTFGSDFLGWQFGAISLSFVLHQSLPIRVSPFSPFDVSWESGVFRKGFRCGIMQFPCLRSESIEWFLKLHPARLRKCRRLTAVQHTANYWARLVQIQMLIRQGKGDGYLIGSSALVSPPNCETYSSPFGLHRRPVTSSPRHGPWWNSILCASLCADSSCLVWAWRYQTFLPLGRGREMLEREREGWGAGKELF